MKKVLVLEIVLLVAVIAAAAFFVWQINTVQPQAVAEEPQTVQTTEPEASAQQPQEQATEDMPVPGENPETAAEPAETLHAQEAWEEVLKDYDLTAETYFIYDLSADRFVLRSDAVDTLIYPASITKLFTAYVALLHASSDDEITVGKEIKLIDKDSSVAYLKEGDVLTVEELIAGMLLPSGNDAAYALTTAIGRKLADDQELSPQKAMERFAEQMNEDAKAVGMTDSHFMTTDGNHDSDHYISLGDMVTLGKLALNNEVIARYAAASQKTADAGDDRSLEWNNTNLLLKEDSDYYCDQAVGLKTGYTTPAGYCMLSAVRIGQRDLLIGVFGCQKEEARFADTLLLLAQNFMLDIYEPVSNAPDEPVTNEAA